MMMTMVDGDGLETWAIGVIGGVSALVLLLVIALIVFFVVRARRTSSTASDDGEKNDVETPEDVPLQQSAPQRANIYAAVAPLDPGNYTAPPARPPPTGVYDVAPPFVDE